MTIPERARFTGTAIVGAIGTRKDELLHVPFLGQILAYRASDDTKRIGATVGFVLRSHRRAQLEDEFLKKNLPGYADYVRAMCRQS